MRSLRSLEEVVSTRSVSVNTVLINNTLLIVERTHPRLTRLPRLNYIGGSVVLNVKCRL